jgi:menaquinone-dependent protoporphyrinogen IX oxidase
MQLISARTGRPTDTSRDWDFTDWDQVDRLGMELADRLAGSLAPLEQACST